MKNRLIVMIVSLSLFACNKEEGLNIKFKTSYKSETSTKSQRIMVLKNSKHFDGTFTQFGNLIGTITPDKVTAKFMGISYLDRDINEGPATTVSIIEPNVAYEDTSRFADFTNGNTVEVTPTMYGNIGNDGWFAEDNIVLTYLGILPEYFLFEFTLPEQYDGVTFIMNNNLGPGFGFPRGFNELGTRNGRSMLCLSQFFLQHEYEGAGNAPLAYFFGGTDSCYTLDAASIPEWEKCGLLNMIGNHGIAARSNNYSAPVLTRPSEGATKIITTTVSFDSQDLIQYYAGADNIAYTYDDLFVFPHNFWERFSIILDQN